MRILVLVDRYETTKTPNSLGRIVQETSKRLAARGDEIVIVARCFDPQSPLSENLSYATVARYRASSALQASRAVFDIVRRLHGEHAFDVIHSHLAICDFAARLALPQKPPFIRTFHGSWAMEGWSEFNAQEASASTRLLALLRRFSQNLIERSSIRAANRVIVLSDFSRKYVATTFNYDNAKIINSGGGVDSLVYNIPADRARLRMELGFAEHEFVVAVVGRLIRWKGVYEIYDAVTHLHKNYPHVRLIFVGSGREEASLRNLVTTQGAQGFVSFCGFQSTKLVDYLGAVNLVAVPSTREETFGMTTIEALACGTPVIGNSLGATPEILRRIDERLIMASSTTQCIIDALTSALTQPWFAALEPAKLRAAVITEYSWDNHCLAVANALDAVHRKSGSYK